MAISYALCALDQALGWMLYAISWLVAANPVQLKWASAMAVRLHEHERRRLQACRIAPSPAPPHALLPPMGPSSTRLLVVGCGLSGAQLASHALQCGWSHVTILCRGRLVVRPFDLDGAWMGRNLCATMPSCETEFFSASYVERRKLLSHARPGGSLTSAAHQQLLELQKSGRVQLREHTYVCDAHWHRPSAATAGSWRLVLGGAAEGQAVYADAVWLATGHDLDIGQVGPLRMLCNLRPQTVHDGLPELTPSLRWDSQTQLYVAGALAALQVGPDALNLGGCGQCASRIISDILASA